jgi:hypothetical protein
VQCQKWVTVKQRVVTKMGNCKNYILNSVPSLTISVLNLFFIEICLTFPDKKWAEHSHSNSFFQILILINHLFHTFFLSAFMPFPPLILCPYNFDHLIQVLIAFSYQPLNSPNCYILFIAALWAKAFWSPPTESPY